MATLAEMHVGEIAKIEKGGLWIVNVVVVGEGETDPRISSSRVF
jgi:hypothetical protein